MLRHRVATPVAKAVLAVKVAVALVVAVVVAVTAPVEEGKVAKGLVHAIADVRHVAPIVALVVVLNNNL